MRVIAKRHVNRVLKYLRNERKRGSTSGNPVSLDNNYFLVLDAHEGFRNHCYYVYGFYLVKQLTDHTLYTSDKVYIDHYEFDDCITLIGRKHPDYKDPTSR